MEYESIIDIKLHKCHKFKPRSILWSLTKAMVFSYFNHGSKRQHPMKNYNLFNYVILVGCVIYFGGDGQPSQHIHHEIASVLPFLQPSKFSWNQQNQSSIYPPQTSSYSNRISSDSLLFQRNQFFFNEVHWVFILVSINFWVDLS